MNLKKSLGAPLLALLVIVPVHPEIITWRANVGQQYETKITLKESVIGLDSISEKPALVTVNALYQEEAARNQSTIPHLKGMPSFPRTSVEPGSSWKADTTILYDLSAFGLKEPLAVTVKVSYTHLGMEILDSRTYHHIKAEWFPFHVLPASDAKRSGIKRLSGASKIDLLWDNKSGSPKQSLLVEETQYLFSDNTSLLFRRELGENFKTTTDIVRERIIRQITDEILSQKVADVEVKQADEGVVLSVENIQFEPDSAVLVEAERNKLSGIGKVLSALGERKLSIVGHAAAVPGSTEEELRELSSARAASVASYLVDSGFRTASSVVSNGVGGSKPLYSNETTEGRRKNRRVEIIILDEENNQ